jgi:hypothetical protein
MVYEIEVSLSFSALILEFKNKAEIYTFSRITPTGGRNSEIAERATLEFFDVYLLGKSWLKVARFGWARSKH